MRDSHPAPPKRSMRASLATYSGSRRHFIAPPRCVKRCAWCGMTADHRSGNCPDAGASVGVLAEVHAA